MEGEKFMWPQRNYICSFCKRQFNSAQALGGHMNVHRRDRAMLIQLPKWVFDKSPKNPNSSGSSSSSSSSSTFPHWHYSKSSSTRPFESSSISLTKDLSKINNVDKMTPHHHVVEVEELEQQKQQIISLDLEIGCKDHSKEVLDLELRLGCF